jgi:hypothetical protein
VPQSIDLAGREKVRNMTSLPTLTHQLDRVVVWRHKFVPLRMREQRREGVAD